MEARILCAFKKMCDRYEIIALTLQRIPLKILCGSLTGTMSIFVDCTLKSNDCHIVSTLRSWQDSAGLTEQTRVAAVEANFEKCLVGMTEQDFDDFCSHLENSNFKSLTKGRTLLLNLPVLLPTQMANHMKNIS